MSRIWFSGALETVATFWRVVRRDGVALGFTTHDRDIWFDGIAHRAMPGMIPSAIRRSADFEPDSAEVQGALTHDSISAEDLAAGRFDGARVAIGLVDWDSRERMILYQGAIGAVSEEAGQFTAALQSRKAELQIDPIPRTSPSCRAVFCGPGCALSPGRFDHEAVLVSSDLITNSVSITCDVAPGQLVGGSLRWLEGAYAGMTMRILGEQDAGLVVDVALDAPLLAGLRAIVREGCDRTLATCSARFANALNFQGEPFLPGNDLIARYPAPSQ